MADCHNVNFNPIKEHVNHFFKDSSYENKFDTVDTAIKKFCNKCQPTETGVAILSDFNHPTFQCIISSPLLISPKTFLFQFYLLPEDTILNSWQSG